MTNNDITALTIAQDWALSEALETRTQANMAENWAAMAVLYTRAAHLFTLAGSEHDAKDCRRSANLWARMAVKYQN